MKTFTKLVLFIIAVSFLLMPFVAFGGVREQAAVAEAVVYVAQVTQPQLPNDFENKPRGESPSIPPEVRHDAREKLTARPSLELFGNTETVGRVTVEYYGADWCVPCKQQEKINSEGHPLLKIVKSSGAAPRIEVVDTTGRLTFRDASLPLFVWSDANGKRLCHEGLTSLESLAAKIDRNNAPSNSGDNASESTGAVGAIRGRAVIVSAIETWRRNIGSAKATATWTRNGAQTLPLLRASQWTPQTLLGTEGSFRFAAPGSRLPVDRGEVSYRIEGDEIRLRGETVISTSILQSDSSNATSAEPVGITPLTILTVITSVYQLLNPQMDITLPGELEATGQLSGDLLTIRFTKAPSVRIVALFRFTLSVEAVEISANKVRVLFSGSRWIRERTFEVR